MTITEAHPRLAAAMTPADVARHAREVAAATGLTVRAAGDTLTFTGPHGTLTRRLRPERDAPAPDVWRPSDALSGLLARELRPISRLATWYAATFPKSRTHAARDDGLGTLCGATAGCRALTVHGHPFTPSGEYEAPSGRILTVNTCRDCADLFTALFLPETGPPKVCDGPCGRERPGNWYRRDLHSRDRKSRTCTLCWDQRRRVRAAAEVMAA